MRAACDVVGEGGAARRRARHGRVLPAAAALGAERAACSRALAERAELVVIAGLTGVAKADAEVVASVARLGGALDADARLGSRPRTAPRCARSPTPTTKCASIVRGIVDAMRDGVPLERMAVVVGNREPYAAPAARASRARGHRAQRRVRAHARRLRARPRPAAPARAARPRLPPRRRVRVARRRAGARRPRASRCPRSSGSGSSRDAGVVAGVDGVERRASTHYAAGRPSRRRRAAAAARRARPAAALWRGSSAALADDLAARARARGRGSAHVGARLVARWIGAEAARDRLVRRSSRKRPGGSTPRSTGSAGSTRSRPAPTLEVFRRSLALELDAARDRVGRLGEGVLVGSAALALGVELDRVWVCGLAEGVFPAPPRDDPLLADADRGALGGELPLRADRIADDQRALLAALASTSGDRTLCFPRGDLRRNTEHVPSRFLLDTVEALAGDRQLDADAAQRPWCTIVPSFLHGLTHAPFPATRHELDVRAALARRAADRGGPRGRARRRARAGARGARRSPASTATSRTSAPCSRPRARPRPASTVSATRLETWVKCPHAYFVKHLLHVQPIERPEELIQLSPLDKGNIVHDTLDAFLSELQRRRRCRPAVVGGAARARSTRSSREACDEIEARGLGGRRLLWARARRELHAQLDAFLDFDGDVPRRTTAPTRSRPSSRSAAGQRAPARSRSPAATAAACASSARSTASTASPTAGSRSSTTRAAPPPRTRSSRTRSRCSAGRMLQLPIYAHAARAPYVGDGPTQPVARVVLVRAARAEEAARATPSTRAVEGALDETLRVIVDGIDAGLFPPRPPRARLRSVHGVRLLRPRRARHDRHVPGVGAQAGRARAGRLPRAHERPMTNVSGDQAAREAVRTPARRDAVRRGGRGHGQDDRARRPHRRAGHRRRPRPARCRCAASPRSRSPRRRRPSCATACAASSSSGRTTSRCRPARAVRCVEALDDSTTPRSARCTRSRSGSSPRSRSRSGCRRASRCTTKSRRCSSFEERWRRTRDDLLDDPELERSLLVLLAARRRLDHLRRVAEFLDDNWDLLDRIDEPPPLPAVDLDRLARGARRPCARLPTTAATDDDKLLVRLAELEEYGERLQRAVDDAARIELLLAEKPSFQVQIGRKDELARHRRACATASCGSASSATTLVERGHRRRAARDRRVPRAAHRRARRRAPPRGRARVPRPARARRVAAARSGARPPGPRASCASGTSASSSTSSRTPTRSRSRSRRCSPRPTTTPTATTGGVPRSTPGRLFFVGDPKQSIYRFRRADIATFLEARDHFADEPLQLTCNFRSTEPVLAWINHVFGRLIQPAAGSQPEYFALEHQRGPRRRPVRACWCSASTRSTATPSADAVREQEATERRGRGARPRSTSGGRSTTATREWRDAAARRRLHPVAGAHVARTSSSARSTTRASRTAPRRARSCTARARSATC